MKRPCILPISRPIAVFGKQASSRGSDQDDAAQIRTKNQAGFDRNGRSERGGILRSRQSYRHRRQ